MGLVIAFAKETDPRETRAACLPATVARYGKLGCNVRVQSGIGERCFQADEDYRAAGAAVVDNFNDLVDGADVVVRVRSPQPGVEQAIPAGAVHISYLDAFNHRDIIEGWRQQHVQALSMEMVPRSTLAQKLDALSSQHSIAGYYMVMAAAERCSKVLPMMTTPAGTLQPARVFVIGAGVAGLQAIATAKRLGARVEAFDTRPEVEEQVQSLGAKFVKIDLGETSSSRQGYATALTDEQLDKQRAGMAKVCAESDIVITTAQLFGRPAPEIISKDMVAGMKPGSIIVDYAVNSGGNVAGSRPDEEVLINGVRIIGFSNFPGQVALSASTMYANNCYYLVEELVTKQSVSDKDAQEQLIIDLDKESDIIDSVVITRDGDVVNSVIRKHYQLDPIEEPAPCLT